MKIPLSQIKVSPDRQRHDLGDIARLASSIKSMGLIHPIVVDPEFNLIAGGRRYAAVTSLGWTEVEVTNNATSDPFQRELLELEENTSRKDLSWKERVLAIARIHERMSLAKAREGRDWLQIHTGELIGQTQANVSYALTVSGLLGRGDDEVEQCTSVKEVLRLLAKRAEVATAKVLAEKVKATMPPVVQEASGQLMLTPNRSSSTPTPAVNVVEIPLSRSLLHGDCISILPTLPAQTFNHVITDIPYGIAMENLRQENVGMRDVGDVQETHQVDQNLEMMPVFLRESFRLTKDTGFCVFWYDLQHHEKLMNWAIEAGWRVQRWPLIWVKSHPCQNTAAAYNFTKTYEVCMVCRKPNAMLTTPQPRGHFTCNNGDVPDKLGHPFAKPYELWTWIMKAVTIPGQMILDPYAGCGSSIIAAYMNDLVPTGIEKLDDVHAKLVGNVISYFRTRFGENVSFS